MADSMSPHPSPLTPDGREWRPAASLARLRLRAELLTEVRAFFAARGVLEVDTPALSFAGTTDAHIASFATVYRGPGERHGQPLYLHTSPEFAMKRLLAAGSGCIYQLAKVFRDGEAGRRHNPEFTLLEWYRVGFDHHRLMHELAELVARLLDGRIALGEPEKLSYAGAFIRRFGFDPHRASVRTLEGVCKDCGIVPPPGMPEDARDPWLDLLLTHAIEPDLGRGRLTFLYDYPPSQASLARIRRQETPVGERFEAYLEGVELANGFHELGDAAEQRARFEADLDAREAAGLPAVPIDEALLEALAAGLPACSGVALGFDRLLMLAAGAQSLDEVIAFPIERA